MAVLKWLALVLALVGLAVAALMGFGHSSYSFGDSEATRCGSMFLPKNPDDVLCDELRADSAMLFTYAVVLAVVGLAGFLIARRLSLRLADTRPGEPDLRA